MAMLEGCAMRAAWCVVLLSQIVVLAGCAANSRPRCCAPPGSKEPATAPDAGHKLKEPSLPILLLLSDGDADYLERILARARYNRGAADLNRNVHIRAHDPAEMEAIFEENKGAVIGALVSYLKTYDGDPYPQVTVKVYGKPLPPGGEDVVFHVRVVATISPREGRGIRPLLDDTYSGAVFWDVVARRVKYLRLNGGQLRTVPGEVLDSALRLARQYDERYAARFDRTAARWIPRWYVEHVILWRQREGLPVASEYSTIIEYAGHHVVLLNFHFFEEATSIREIPSHAVAVDVDGDRVLGVHRRIVDAGPMY